MAFDEAIERFDISRSKSFLKFAEMVIKKENDRLLQESIVY